MITLVRSRSVTKWSASRDKTTLIFSRSLTSLATRRVTSRTYGPSAGLPMASDFAIVDGRTKEVVVNHRARQFGKSKYGISRIWKVFLDLLTISVEAVAPGRIVRTQAPGGSDYTVFRVGEMSGNVTARAEAVEQLERLVHDPLRTCARAIDLVHHDDRLQPLLQRAEGEPLEVQRHRREVGGVR